MSSEPAAAAHNGDDESDSKQRKDHGITSKARPSTSKQASPAPTIKVRRSRAPRYMRRATRAESPLPLEFQAVEDSNGG